MKITEIQPNDPIIYVGVLTEEQKDQLTKQWFAPDSYFNTVQDINGIWFISTIQINDCVNPDFLWVKDLDMIEYVPQPPIELSNMFPESTDLPNL
jgi:hypothetical protein